MEFSRRLGGRKFGRGRISPSEEEDADRLVGEPFPNLLNSTRRFFVSRRIIVDFVNFDVRTSLVSFPDFLFHDARLCLFRFLYQPHHLSFFPPKIQGFYEPGKERSESSFRAEAYTGELRGSGL